MSPVEIATVLFIVAIVHWANLVLPGPNVLLVARLAASGQRRTALAVGLGMSTLVLAWSLLAAVGLTDAIAHPGPLRTTLQVVGGAWFCVLAHRLWQPDASAVPLALRSVPVALAATVAPGATSATLAAGAPGVTEANGVVEAAALAVTTEGLNRSAAFKAEGDLPVDHSGQDSEWNLAGAFGLGLATAAANPVTLLFPLAIFIAIVPHDGGSALKGLVALVLFVDAAAWYAAVAQALSRPAVCSLYLRHRTLLARASSTLIALMGARMIALALATA